MPKQSPLEAAAARVLRVLRDDHEDCYLCDASENTAHDPQSACGELTEALANTPERRKAWGKIARRFNKMMEG